MPFNAIPVQDERIIARGNENVPTQIANPRRTTWRTIVQAILGHLVVLVPLSNGILIALQAYLNEHSDVIVPAWVYLAINTGIAVTSFIIGLVARIMAIPGVAEWIARHLPWLYPIKPKAPATSDPEAMERFYSGDRSTQSK